MTFDGYLAFGGHEVINSERARGYAESANCPMHWLKGAPCTTLAEAVGDTRYSYADIATAPWYDSTIDEISRRFYGVFGLAIDGVEDSTRSATVTEGIADGGVIGRSRRAMRNVTARMLLMGYGQDAVEYGMSWLTAVLDPDACGTPSINCGTSEMSVFSSCPPVRITDETNEDYGERVDLARRFMRNAGAISGPFKVSEMESNGFWAYEVQFTLAGGPSILGVTRALALSPTLPTIIQDVPFNLIPFPSAELASGSITVSTNLATNPSVEINASGWAASSAATFSSGEITSGRVTDELSAVGTSSFRSVLTPIAAGTAASNTAWFSNDQEVDLSPSPLGSRVSVNIWSAAVVMSGTPTLEDIRVYAFWRATSGGTSLRTDFLGTIPKAGGALSVASIQPPPTAAFVLIRAQVPLTAWGAGNVVRLYSDALTVSVP